MSFEDHILTVVAREWFGLAIAGVVFTLAFVAYASGGPSPIGAIAASLLFVAGLVLAVGALRHLAAIAHIRRHHPPPGRLVEVGGQRMHIVAEGRIGGGPTIVWLPGGHVGGFAMHHLHAALRSQVRSVLVDRFGTGWSDVGRFPRTTAREAAEVIEALDAAGEHGPFVLAGHSFGGLLAANIARRHPERTHSLVLIDPTPLDVVAFGPRLAALKEMRQTSLRAAWLALFGIDVRARQERKQRATPGYALVFDDVARVLGEAGKVHRAVEAASAGAWFASASIYRELIPHGLADRAWETVVYDGDLGDLPVYLVAPQDTGEVATLDEMKGAAASEAARMTSFFEHCRERYLAISTRSRRIVAPAGSGHNFPYATPAFLVDVMRGIACGDDAHSSAHLVVNSVAAAAHDAA